jgi:hypothetical protein
MKAYSLFIVLFIGVLVSGCQGNSPFKGFDSVSSGSLSADQKLGLDKVDESTKILATDITTVLAEIDSTTNSGVFDNNFSNYSALLLSDAETNLNGLLSQMTANLDKAKATIDLAKENILKKKASISPNSPFYKSANEFLDKILSNLTRLSDQISEARSKVISKASNLIVKIETFINKLKGNPIFKLLFYVLNGFKVNLSLILDILMKK